MQHQVSELAVAFPQRKSLELDFSELEKYNVELADGMVENPDEYLNAARRALVNSAQAFLPPGTKGFAPYVRVYNLRYPLVSVQYLGSEHLNKLVKVDGVIAWITQISPRMHTAVWECLHCEHRLKTATEKHSIKPPRVCQCGRSNFKLLEESSDFLNVQRANMQDLVENLRGNVPTTNVELWMEDDLVNRIAPGEKVCVTGILRLRPVKDGKGKSSVYAKFLDVLHLEKKEEDFEELEVTAEEEAKIIELSRDPQFFQKVNKSVAPGVFGYDEMKQAIALQLFGGTPHKFLPDGQRIRSDAHILLIGDPGTSKSTLLSYVSRLAPKCITVGGKSASSVGLTASAEKDEVSGGWILKAGAMVLANGGMVCLHPDSKVVFDNEICGVSELFDAERAQSASVGGVKVETAVVEGKVASIAHSSLESICVPATKIARKHYCGKLVRLDFDSGFSLRVTPDHLLLDGNSLAWVPARRFAEGDFSVSLLKLNAVNKDNLLFDCLPDDWRVCLSAEESKEWTAIGKRVGAAKTVALGEIRGSSVFEKWRNKSFALGKKFKFSRFFSSCVTPELAYLIGFVYGDGCVKQGKRRSAVFIIQSTKHAAQLNRLRECWQSVFGSKMPERTRFSQSVIRGKAVKSDCVRIQSSSHLFAAVYSYFTSLGLKHLLELNEENMKAFIAGCMDSDGCISNKKGFNKKANKEYVVSHSEFLLSAKEEDNLAFLLALRRLDCLGKYVPATAQSKVGRIRITSREDVSALVDAIKPYSVKASQAFLAVKNTAVRGASGVIPSAPVAEIARQIAKLNTSKLVERGLWSRTWEYRHETRPLSRSNLAKMLEFAKTSLDEATVQKINCLLARDYFLDKITRVSQEDYDGYVYDLYVPKSHNFLADGVLVHNCVDELDKMDDEDRSALHQAMEQQIVSVAKAGMITQFQTRTSVLAAANPKHGRFDPNALPAQQFEISPTLLSRFDLIFPIRDVIDESNDRKIAAHILLGHKYAAEKQKPEEGSAVIPAIPVDFLRKYIAYARKNIAPILSQEASDKIQEFYLEMRRMGKKQNNFPITARYIEGIIRLAEASAKARLSPVVGMQDAERAIALQQYVLKEVFMDKETGKIDTDVINIGQSKSRIDKMRTVLAIIRGLEKKFDQVAKEDVYKEAADAGIDRTNSERIIDDLLRQGELFSPKAGYVKNTTRDKD